MKPRLSNGNWQVMIDYKNDIVGVFFSKRDVKSGDVVHRWEVYEVFDLEHKADEAAREVCDVLYDTAIEEGRAPKQFVCCDCGDIQSITQVRAGKLCWVCSLDDSRVACNG